MWLPLWVLTGKDKHTGHRTELRAGLSEAHTPLRGFLAHSLSSTHRPAQEPPVLRGAEGPWDWPQLDTNVDLNTGINHSLRN